MASRTSPSAPPSRTWPEPTGFTGGTVWVMNGATGKAIQRLDISSPQYDSRYAERVTRAGDITGDGLGGARGCLEPARSDRL